MSSCGLPVADYRRFLAAAEKELAEAREAGAFEERAESERLARKALGLGMVQLFNAIPGSMLALKIGSAAYLLYLAWKIANAAPPKGDASHASAGKPFTFLQAVLFQWVNPKAWTMALTAIGAYTIPENPMVSLLIVAGVFGAINLPCVSSWTVLGTQIRRLLSRPLHLRIFNVTAALLLVASLYPILATTIDVT